MYLLGKILLNQQQGDAHSLNYLNAFSNFTDLYLTLDSFGVHITKTVWLNIHKVLQIHSLFKQIPAPNDILVSLSKINCVEILVKKAGAHRNDKTIKNCLKALFKQSKFLQEQEQLFLESLIGQINVSTLFNDKPIEADSKYYKIVNDFYIALFKDYSNEEY